MFRPGEGIALNQGGLRISATTDQIYTLTFIDDNGCEITKTLKVSVRQNNEFFAPLIFSPNNDGINDFWLPSWGSSWTRAEIKIYDRWGALMASLPQLRAGMAITMERPASRVCICSTSFSMMRKVTLLLSLEILLW
ncbi:MAG: T9SS type B sorting domain-containing protein [Saprospiraceae bacterium]|nr:T9SS type B sorting domain-containing protein [Candidatus Vicinibacter affinis]